MSHSNQGRRRWKENRRRRRQEEARHRRIDAALAEPGLRENDHRRYERYLMCERKHAYASEDEAIRGCIHASFRTGKPFRTYQCPLCHNWHITTRVEQLA